KTLSAVVGAGTRSNPQMESPSQGREAGLLMVSEGLDLIVGQNLNSAVSASPSEPCPGLFFDAAYGRARYGAGGGDVDLASFSGLLGAACSSYLDSGVLTMGGFVELGRGSYDVKLDLGDRVVRGDGDLRRIGGGVLARFEFDSRTNKKFYLHSSLRGGRLSQDYQSPDLLNSQNSGRHDTSSMYVAGHLGLGAEVHLAGGALLDFYARYGHTYLKGADAMVDGTAPVNYKAAVSSRARAGGRYAFNLGERARLQLGLGYDHEFDARTKATTGGLPVNTPDMSGGSAVAEINAAYLRPGPVPVSLSIGLEGFMGRRKGVVGSLKFTVAF
ncbi:MAG: autotransporter outer membrane beta-barrel domain-containing protein, partial [Deltaproteobacteria bacterium]|nr:autotransporter outer membrane beta-barrel domain-containing protein [Deltaproteobacteria bacterium]